MGFVNSFRAVLNNMTPNLLSNTSQRYGTMPTLLLLEVSQKRNTVVNDFNSAVGAAKK